MLIAFIGFHRLLNFIEHPVALNHGFLLKVYLTVISNSNFVAKIFKINFNELFTDQIMSIDPHNLDVNKLDALCTLHIY